MYYTSLFRDVNSIFDEIETYAVSSNVLYKAEKDKLEIAVSVLGHDPKNVEVELTTDKIFVKAEKNKEDKSLKNSFVHNINESLKLHSDFDGLTAKAKIDNGILHITVEKKEESKPKKLSIKF
jgi:HSP20 family protein